MEALLRETPGRIWEGKESVLEAIAAVGAATAAAAGSATAGDALPAELRQRAVAALLDAASKKRQAYRRAALQQLEALLSAYSRADGSGGSADGSSDSAGSTPDRPSYYASTSPLLLELAAAFVTAQGGAVAMDTDQPSASAGGGDGGGGGSGKVAEAAAVGADGEGAAGSVPAAEAVSCLAAAFATTAAAEAAAQGDAAAAAVASVLAAAARPADLQAAVAAGRRIADHTTGLPGAALVGAGGSALLEQALRVAGEAKAAQLREAGMGLARALLEQGWGGMGAERREAARAAARELAARERLPALQAVAAELAGRLDSF